MGSAQNLPVRNHSASAAAVDCISEGAYFVVVVAAAAAGAAALDVVARPAGCVAAAAAGEQRSVTDTELDCRFAGIDEAVPGLVVQAVRWTLGYRSFHGSADSRGGLSVLSPAVGEQMVVEESSRESHTHRVSYR